MMTGTASVSKALFLYRLFTVLPLFFFALYDHRHHKVRNAALLAFLPWCLFYVPLSIRQEPLLPDALVILTAALGFFCGGMLLLLISMVTNESIGGGDIKLVALLGICHGASGILEILVASSLLALMHLGGRSFSGKEAGADCFCTLPDSRILSDHAAALLPVKGDQIEKSH